MQDKATIPNSQNNALVSIIIPAYNTEKYIHRAIESSIRQTHTNTEIIIIDDGSSDNTLKTAQYYADNNSRVKVIHQDNKGVSAARNNGIREAKGEYIIFLDSDDWLDTNAVDFLLNSQDEYPGILITTGHYSALISENGKVLRRLSNLSFHNNRSFNKQQAVEFWFSSACCKIFYAEILKKYNIFFREGIHNHEDGLFVFEYINRAENVIYIDKAVWNILNRPGSACNSGYSFKMVSSVIQADNIMIDYPDNTPDIKETLFIRHIKTVLGTLRNAVTSKADISEIIYLRKYIAEHSRSFLLSRKASIPRKLLLLTVFMPVPFMKCAMYFAAFLKKIQIKTAEHKNKSAYEEVKESWLQ